MDRTQGGGGRSGVRDGGEAEARPDGAILTARLDECKPADLPAALLPEPSDDVVASSVDVLLLA